MNFNNFYSYLISVLRHWKRVILLLGLFVLLIVEEVNYGYFYTIYMNHYNKEVTFPVTVKRTDTQSKSFLDFDALEFLSESF